MNVLFSKNHDEFNLRVLSRKNAPASPMQCKMELPFTHRICQLSLMAWLCLALAITVGLMSDFNLNIHNLHHFPFICQHLPQFCHYSTKWWS